MISRRGVTVDDLIGLVAGTLRHEDFVRVAQAVKNDAALQSQLAGFERVRDELIRTMADDKRQVSVEVFTAHLLQRVEPSSLVPAGTKAITTWVTPLSNFFAGSSMPARLAYGLVAIQAVGITWLVSGALQTNNESTTSTRNAGTENKQLGELPGSVIFNVSFDPATPESTVRGLLLELEAQIIAGPSRLGQYKIVVARNRSHLALLKLREATFIEQVTEIVKEADKPEVKDGDKK